MARAAASPSTDTKSTHSANFFTMWLGIFANCFSAVLDISTRTSPVYPNTGNSQANAGNRWCLAGGWACSGGRCNGFDGSPYKGDCSTKWKSEIELERGECLCFRIEDGAENLGTEVT